ncbi:MAG TPA: hypothetical protein PL017_12680 [Tenuifilaceae bacterium]|nr:hypothetical protein [Tenuifilaceae bacterium]HPJ46945.1 hypothetical protein [Tenuifilaceae bacterium]HPQ35424.1 hypothetical protein [Tenuifilaceae bacterium]
MLKLTDSQVDVVINKIKEQSLKSFAFSEELLDHVCCRIEQFMESGSSFESALNQSSYLFERKEIRKTKKNFTILFNYSGFINSFIIYASLLFYLGSWIFHWGQADWVGLVAFVLISILLFRYSLLFYSDSNLKFKKSLVTLSTVGFVLFFIGCLKRFLWLDFGFSGKHVMPLMLFSWLIISVAGIIYQNELFPKKRNRLFYSIGIMQIVLACLGLSTFIFPFTIHYIPLYATVIIFINILSFLLLYVIKAKGKSFLRLIIVCSSFMVFIYTPHKTLPDGNILKVQFEVNAKENVQYPKLYLYMNYYQHGKETLVLYKKADSLYSSGVIDFYGGNLKMSYAVLADSLSLQDVLYSSDIEKNELTLNQADTTFTLTFNPKPNP